MTIHEHTISYGYMRLPAVLQIYPVGRSTWWAGVKNGRFPQPVKLGPKTTAWKIEDIRQLIENPVGGGKPRSFVERIQPKASEGGWNDSMTRQDQLFR